jgi:hypothetical protein
MASLTRAGGGGCQGPFGDDDLHGLDALASPGIVAIAQADQAVAVLRDELLGALLARPQSEPGWRAGGLGGRGARAVRAERAEEVSGVPRGAPARRGSSTADAVAWRRPSESTA